MLEELKKNIQRLIALYEREKAEKEKFRVALAEANALYNALRRQANDASRKRITELEEQIDNLKLTAAFTSSGDNTAAREKIEKMIREIDKCISIIES